MAIKTLPNSLAMALIVAACASPQDPNGETRASLQTDQQSYALTRVGDGYRTQIVADFVNRSQKPLYIARCRTEDRGPLYQFYRPGSALPDNDIGRAWACPGGNVEPLIVAAGASRVDTLEISVSETRARAASLPADFLARYAVYRTYDSATKELRDPLSQEGESNTFTVRLAQ